ncbi:MAG: CPBP family intramembrane metalloprotease [Lachnospiraceae bacterium]|nr:CPBP family intramembrane metalloprotease [Lachnospiraceae bacterium]
MQKEKKVFVTVFAIYLLCYGFRLLEYFILRTDQTWVGEAIVHKLIGIAILFIAAKQLRFTTREIGFSKENSLRNVMMGLAFGIGVFIVAYAVEVLIAVSQGSFDSLQIYVSAYAIDQNVGCQTDALFFVICIVGNIVNVFMEEGIFRGLFAKILEQKYRVISGAIIASILFGFWHVIGPIRNYCDGTTSMGGMIANVIMLLVTSTLVGFKFAMLTEMTGNHYMAMGDHFVNNTIVNLLHVVSESGADELMVVRVSIAQSVSFIVVLARYIQLRYKKG